MNGFPTPHSQPPALNALRAEIYRILSECYKEPSVEFAADVARGYLNQELSKHLTRLGIVLSLEGLKIESDAEEVFRILKEQYYPLFMGPFPPFVLPVESVHKAWARGGTTPLLSPDVRGMLMGDPAVDILRRYEASGIEIPKEFKDMPDHLALLLEYMAFLCENGTPAEQERFAREHLDWVPELHRSVHACSESRFYRAVADTTDAVVACEERALGDGEKSHELLDQNRFPP